MPAGPRDTWSPVGIEALEPAALEAVKHDGSACVTAGPGAGKTELLAQRAAYLLMSGMCKRPQRILAISFKRDAAKNLSERVRERCGAELSRRLTSVTFDSFTKSIVDRFGLCLPVGWRPPAYYEIDGIKRHRIENFLNRNRALSHSYNAAS